MECDNEVIDFAFKQISEDDKEDLKIHFIFACEHLEQLRFEHRLKSFILEQMTKYTIKSVMMTTVSMHRTILITSQHEKDYCMGKQYEKNSVNEDLETFFENVRNGNSVDSNLYTYFLPKLTEEQMELVEKKDSNYLATFSSPSWIVDKLTKYETSKYVECICYRSTLVIENKSS